jgi:hypothetical protein
VQPGIWWSLRPGRHGLPDWCYRLQRRQGTGSTTIERRVANLEEASGGGGGECPRCGWGGGADDNQPYEVNWVDPGGAGDEEEFCEEGGRQLVVVTWGDGARDGAL